MDATAIKVGVVTDQSGPLSVMVLANANVARMVVNDINIEGGLLGRKIELIIEDSATTDSVAETKAAKLAEQDNVDVVFGGIYSSTRQAIKRAAVEKAGKLYIYPEQYEGQEHHPLIGRQRIQINARYAERRSGISGDMVGSMLVKPQYSSAGVTCHAGSAAAQLADHHNRRTRWLS